ncbi:B12-binding domain-containing protein [Paenibacillus sp. TRM 82003]|nr:B12-binding domain-containing protein [Paenibacillus sp. TRM 82003]
MSFEARAFAEQLLQGNQAGAWDLVMRYREAGKNSLFIYNVLFTGAMRHIGDLWEQNRISVADEHLASAVCDIVMDRYAAAVERWSEVKAGKAMFFCLENEDHYLGLKTVSQLFEEYGWESRFYGPNLPLDYALVGAMNWKPDVIGLSVSLAYQLPKLKEYVSELEKLPFRPLVMVGGRLTGKYNMEQYCSAKTMLVTDLVEVQQWLQQPKTVSRQTTG